MALIKKGKKLENSDANPHMSKNTRHKEKRWLERKSRAVTQLGQTNHMSNKYFININRNNWIKQRNKEERQGRCQVYKLKLTWGSQDGGGGRTWCDLVMTPSHSHGIRQACDSTLMYWLIYSMYPQGCVVMKRGGVCVWLCVCVGGRGGRVAWGVPPEVSRKLWKQQRISSSSWSRLTTCLDLYTYFRSWVMEVRSVE